MNGAERVVKLTEHSSGIRRLEQAFNSGTTLLLGLCEQKLGCNLSEASLTAGSGAAVLGSRKGGGRPVCASGGEHGGRRSTDAGAEPPIQRPGLVGRAAYGRGAAGPSQGEERAPYVGGGRSPPPAPAMAAGRAFCSTGQGEVERTKEATPAGRRSVPARVGQKAPSRPRSGPDAISVAGVADRPAGRPQAARRRAAGPRSAPRGAPGKASERAAGRRRRQPAPAEILA